jgi:hypothetical protein
MTRVFGGRLAPRQAGARARMNRRLSGYIYLEEDVAYVPTELSRFSLSYGILLMASFVFCSTPLKAPTAR